VSNIVSTMSTLAKVKTLNQHETNIPSFIISLLKIFSVLLASYVPFLNLFMWTRVSLVRMLVRKKNGT